MYFHTLWFFIQFPVFPSSVPKSRSPPKTYTSHFPPISSSHPNYLPAKQDFNPLSFPPAIYFLGITPPFTPVLAPLILPYINPNCFSHTSPATRLRLTSGAALVLLSFRSHHCYTHLWVAHPDVPPLAPCPLTLLLLAVHGSLVSATKVSFLLHTACTWQAKQKASSPISSGWTGSPLKEISHI